MGYADRLKQLTSTGQTTNTSYACELLQKTQIYLSISEDWEGVKMPRPYIDEKQSKRWIWLELMNANPTMEMVHGLFFRRQWPNLHINIVPLQWHLSQRQLHPQGPGHLREESHEEGARDGEHWTGTGNYTGSTLPSTRWLTIVPDWFATRVCLIDNSA